MSYFIKVYDLTTEKWWEENFDNYFLFRKRVVKLKHSKKLVMVARSLLEEEMC